MQYTVYDSVICFLNFDRPSNIRSFQDYKSDSFPLQYFFIPQMVLYLELLWDFAIINFLAPSNSVFEWFIGKCLFKYYIFLSISFFTQNDILVSCKSILQWTLHKKWSFPFRISSINVTKSAVSCGFDHIYQKILSGKLHFLCSGIKILNKSYHWMFSLHFYKKVWNNELVHSH